MGLFERLLKIGFPSSNWQEDPYKQLELDLSAGSLCGVPLGAAMEALSFLGAAEDSRLAHQGSLFYFRKGLIVSIKGARTSGYTGVWQEPSGDDPDYIRTFPGICKYEGKMLNLSSRVTESDVETIFGAPDERNVYDEGIELGYAREDTVMDIKLSPEGRLASIYTGLA